MALIVVAAVIGTGLIVSGCTDSSDGDKRTVGQDDGDAQDSGSGSLSVTDAKVYNPEPPQPGPTPDAAGSPPPIKKVVPWDKMKVDPVKITGELQQLAAGSRQVNGQTVKGCFAVSGQSGQFGKAPQLTLSFVNAAGKVTPLGNLSKAFDQKGQARFQVSSIFQNKAGNLVLALQSTEGFNPDGTKQGLLVIGPEGNPVNEYDFYGSSPYRRPQVVAQADDGRQVVLMNNCEETLENSLVPCQKDSVLAVFKTPDFSDSPTIIPLPGTKGGGAMALVDGLVLIAATGNANVDPASQGQILSLSLQNLGGNLSTTSISLPGVGLGGTQVGYSQGRMLFTVNNSAWVPGQAKPGVVLLGNQQTVPLPMPAKLAFVAGAVFAGEDDVLFSGHSYDAVTALSVTDAYRTKLDNTAETAIPLQDKPMPSQFSIGVVEYDEFSYCYGAAGTGKVAGTLYSTVMMVHPAQ